MTGIADTGFIVALAARRDSYHHWAKSLWATLDGPLLTCEAVMTEAAYHLKSSEIVLGMMESGLFRVSFDLAAHREEIQSLASRYRDRNPDLADLCLVRMSELNPELPIWTVDSNFLVYRRNRREVIPVMMPPTLK